MSTRGDRLAVLIDAWVAGRMDTDEARAFLRDHHRAVLSTIRPDGRPQLSPILVAVDDEGYVASAAGRRPSRCATCAVIPGPACAC